VSLDLDIIWPAFVAGLLVLATHVPLGREILSRGIIFLDLAVAQVAALGVILASTLGLEANGWQVQFVAAGSAIVAALILTWLEKHFAPIQEALIGVIFVLAATAGILLLSNNPHGAEQIKELLSGQLLWVSAEQLWPLAVLSVVVLTLWFGARERLGRIGFYVLFALCVTASVQLVGIYLVFASLIIPAIAVWGMTNKLALSIAFCLGASAYALGLLLSLNLDWPSGPLVVWMLALLAISISLFRKAIKK
jgi:zinc/manganese transport system permease protein